jgi:hypothetical protein
MKSSFHSLILFLSLFCSCQLRRLDSIQFLCSQAHIPAGWRLETRLTLLKWTLYNHVARTAQKTASLLLRKACLQLRCIEVTRLLLAYSLPRECVYRVVAHQWTSLVTLLFLLSGVMSQCCHMIEWTAGLSYLTTFTDRTEKYLPLLLVLSLPGKQLIHRAVP